MCYADDLAITAIGPDRLQHITEALEVLGARSRQLGLLISPPKSRAISFKSPRPLHALQLGGVDIPWTDNHKYLGVVLDSQLRFDREVDFLRARAADRTRPLKYMAGLRQGANQHVMRTYYMAAVRSLVDYAAPTLVTLNNRQTARL